VRAIVSDADIQGQARVLTRILLGEAWRDVWQSLNLTLLTFRDVGLTRDASDALVWEICQLNQAIQLTGNRNSDGPDSLEVTLRLRNTPSSLPVFTIAAAGRVMKNRAYAEDVAVRLLEYLLDIDNLRGTGCLFLP
jgi:hypothetical protein